MSDKIVRHIDQINVYKKGLLWNAAAILTYFKN